MNSTLNNPAPGQVPAPAPTSSNSKPLWAAVGILGVTVLAMGGTMLYQGRPAAPVTAVTAVTAPAGSTKLALNSPAGSSNAADDLIEKPVVVPAKPAPAHATVKKVVQAPKPVPALTYSSANNGSGSSYGSAPAQQACVSCGTVESVTPVQRSAKAEGPGLGAVAGGVLGAVLGNQVGHGNGRAAATVLGALGGGFAGNAIEGNIKKVTVYEVGVRMEDGSRRNVEISQAPNVGSRVTVEGSNLRYR
ncbi:MAG: glycine zipper 2TM domain-containing protein [Polaromonas sp.]|nr:glycine zipper 2TM domain-containing protein [Polaromonas sp.]